MQLRVLGTVELVGRDGRDIPLSPRLRRLLAALLVYAPAVVSVDRLADLQWGPERPGQPEASLHNLIARLRQRLRVAQASAQVVTVPPGYALHLDRDQCDATLFEDLVVAARRQGSARGDERALGLKAGSAATADLLDEALVLWRGTAYAEFADEFAQVESVRLAELRTGAMEDRIDLDLAEGRPAEALDRLPALLAAEPLRERPQAQQMLARYRTGRQAEALEGYQRYRRLLSSELGLEPSAALQQLQAAILRQDRSLSPPAGTATSAEQEPPPADRPRTALQRLPRPPMEVLIGRAVERAQIPELVRPGQVVTLVGPGGVGKTSLALTAAADLVAAFADGVWVGELAALTDPDAVPAAIGTVLSLQPRHSVAALDRLVDFLAPLTLLLVLDNCEHVADACAALVTAVRDGCPGVAVLATSREPLGAVAEQLVPVAPLDDQAAVDLFVARAGRSAPGFVLDQATAPAVAEICRRLDRLPLAIELAAARMRVMSPADLVGRLSWRFRLLRGGPRSSPGRHQSLEALVDWSYELLDAPERTAFQVLSVFTGSFTLAAAERVLTAVRPEVGPDAGGVDAVVLALADRSLLVVDTSTPTSRYLFLETLRSYARERLAAGADENAARRGHADHVLAVISQANTGLFGPEHSLRLAELDEVLDDVRAAHTWALRHDLGLAAELVTRLWRYVECRLPAEVPQWAELTLDAVDTAPASLGRPATGGVSGVAAAGSRFAGDLVKAHGLIERGLATSPGPEAEAYLHFLLVDVALFEGRLDEAGRLGGRVREAAEAGTLGAFGTVAQSAVPLIQGYRGDAAGGIRRAAELGARAEADQNPVGVGWMAYVQGELLLDADPGRAGALLTQAVDLGRRHGDRYLTGVALVSAASVRSRHGDPADALPLFQDVLELWRRAGDWTHQWTTLRNVADLLSRLHRDEAVAVLLGALDARSATVFGDETDRLAQVRRGSRERLGDTRAAELGALGAAMADDEVVSYTRDALR